MSAPLVSIITPTYNHEKYIGDCIRSAQDQTYTNWEMIIVDDGSTDNTFTIAQIAAASDDRIKVFTQKNVGIFRLGETYNFAFAQSKGEYIAVLEGDDVWLPEKLQWQVETMETNKNAVLSWGKAFSSSADLAEDYDLHPVKEREDEIFSNSPIGSAAKALIFTCFIPALTVMVRRASLESLGGFIQNFHLPLVDLPTWQQLSLKGEFIYIPRPLGKWRIYPNQVTKTYTAEMAEGFYKLGLDFYAQNKSLLEINGVKKRDIDRYFKKLLVVNYSRAGRYKLIRKDFKGARKSYSKSIFRFGWNEPLWKLRSAIGLIFSVFKKDIEGFTKKIGRVSYK